MPLSSGPATGTAGAPCCGGGRRADGERRPGPGSNRRWGGRDASRSTAVPLGRARTSLLLAKEGWDGAAPPVPFRYLSPVRALLGPLPPWVLGVCPSAAQPSRVKRPALPPCGSCVERRLCRTRSVVSLGGTGQRCAAICHSGLTPGSFIFSLHCLMHVVVGDGSCQMCPATKSWVGFFLLYFNDIGAVFQTVFFFL